MANIFATQSTLRRAEAATWGGPPPSPPSTPRLRLISWRPFVKNTLRGFAAVEFPSGLRISDITVHEKNGKQWANLPARPQIAKDGRQAIGADGKPLFVPILQWRSRELGDRFSAAVIGLILAEHPDVFDDDDGDAA